LRSEEIAGFLRIGGGKKREGGEISRDRKERISEHPGRKGGGGGDSSLSSREKKREEPYLNPLFTYPCKKKEGGRKKRGY